MNERIFAIVNPASANGSTGRQWPNLIKSINKADVDIDFMYTAYPMHAKKLAYDALKNGYEIILSVGGDGTMNEVLNGFFYEEKMVNKNASLAIFSRGTGCDTIRTLGINNDVYSIINILKSRKSEIYDVGLVEFIDYYGNKTKRYFLNVSDVGLGGETTNRVNKNSKILKGFWSFLFGALTSIMVYKNKDFEISIDDLKINEVLNSVVVANGKYYGGGMKIAPMAEMNDGFFDIILIGDLSKVDLLLNFSKIYKGTHLNHPKVKHYKGRRITVKAKRKALIEVDGEQPGIIEANFMILPKKIKILVGNERRI